MLRQLAVFALIAATFVSCSSKKPGIIECDKNETCPAGQKCDEQRGRCVDIYFPNLGGRSGA